MINYQELYRERSKLLQLAALSTHLRNKKIQACIQNEIDELTQRIGMGSVLGCPTLGQSPEDLEYQEYRHIEDKLNKIYYNPEQPLLRRLCALWGIVKLEWKHGF